MRGGGRESPRVGVTWNTGQRSFLKSTERGNRRVSPRVVHASRVLARVRLRDDRHSATRR